MKNSHRPPAEIDEILSLKIKVEPMLKEKDRARLQRLETRYGVGTDLFLNEVLALHQQRMFSVVEEREPRRNRGSGRRKAGGHNEGRHR